MIKELEKKLYGESVKELGRFNLVRRLRSIMIAIFKYLKSYYKEYRKKIFSPATGSRQ